MTVEDWASVVHTRMFAAPIGISEDTGHGKREVGHLGPISSNNGVVDVGPTTEVLIEQGYEIDRPSRITVQVFSDDDVIQRDQSRGTSRDGGRRQTAVLVGIHPARGKKPVRRTMKAVTFHQHGGPEQLIYEDVAVPVPQAGEVLVRVRACALNHLDIWIRQGIPQLPDHASPCFRVRREWRGRTGRGRGVRAVFHRAARRGVPWASVVGSVNTV